MNLCPDFLLYFVNYYWQAWSQFADELTDFRHHGNIRQAVQCLNLLITNALQHVPDVLQYMSRIQEQSVFNFCAIPQVPIPTSWSICSCLVARSQAFPPSHRLQYAKTGQWEGLGTRLG